MTNSASDETSSATRKTPAPTARATVPSRSMRSGLSGLTRTPVAAAAPAKMPRTTPTTAVLGRSNTVRTTDPPTENIRPPSAQVDSIVGSAAANGRRARAGTATRGRSEASAPGTGRTVSGSVAVTAASTANTLASRAKVSRVG